VKIHVTYVNPSLSWEQTLAPKFVELISNTGVHSVVSTAKASDIVLVVDGHQCQSIDINSRIQALGFSKELDKLVLYDQSDRPKTRLRTLAPSINSKVLLALNARGYSAASTLYVTWPCDLSIPNVTNPVRRVRSWNYVGSTTHPVRKKLMDALRTCEGGCMHDTTEPFASLSVENYVAILSNSKYTFCPRGHGHSSWRIYEAISSNSIPIIISDRFAYPSGLELENSSVQLRESDVSNTYIDRLLDTVNLDSSGVLDPVIEKLKPKYRFDTMMADISKCLHGRGLLGEEDSYVRFVSCYYVLLDKLRNRLLYTNC
jgi:hypothetical protein